MSLFDSFFKKSKLEKADKQVARARKSEGAEADHLFKTAYEGFAEVIANDLLYTETLYKWGFALLHQAKTKTGDEAVKLYEEAIAKFSFCQTVMPTSLGAAIDSGVAYMDLARIKEVSPSDKLYDLAKEQFQRANSIQKGAASYNLACIYALRNDEEACLNALENSKEHGSLPSNDDILADPDLDNMKHHHWFMDFMASLALPEESEAPEEPKAAAESEAVVKFETETVEEAETKPETSAQAVIESEEESKPETVVAELETEINPEKAEK